MPTADRSKATVKVRIALLERDARVVPDMGVRVSFLEDEASSADKAAPATAVFVPGDAVVQRDGASIVFVVNDDRVGVRSVQTAPARDGRQRVERGLAAGETVVLSPPATLMDGDRVAIEP